MRFFLFRGAESWLGGADAWTKRSNQNKKQASAARRTRSASAELWKRNSSAKEGSQRLIFMRDFNVVRNSDPIHVFEFDEKNEGGSAREKASTWLVKSRRLHFFLQDSKENHHSRTKSRL